MDGEATDLSKLFLGVVLALVVSVLVFPPRQRPLAAAPKDPTTVIGDDSSEDTSDVNDTVTRGAGFINRAAYGADVCLPLALMMPLQGGAPILGKGGQA